MFKLPELGYAFDALEPHIDALTMEIHHDRHHNAYVNNLNAALEDAPEFFEKTIEEIVTNLDAVPENMRGAVRNNGGGHFNHSFFWKLLAPGYSGAVTPLHEAIEKEFGSVANFEETFAKAAVGRFGSGWAWLVIDNHSKKLEVISTANQDTPLELGKTPLVGLDVWEHAYYLNYQNKRPDYVSAFWSVVNWDVANELFEAAR